MIRASSLALLLLAVALTSLGSPLPFTTDYNVTVFGSLSVTSSSVAGSVAAAGSASFVNFAIANGSGGATGAAAASGTNAINLVAGGSLTMVNGQLANGSGVYGGSASLVNIGVPNGTIANGALPVDFTAMQAEALQASADFAAIAANGTSTVQYGGLTMSGANATLNVFTINASTLGSVNNVSINVPTGAAVLINVVGLGTSFKNAGLALNGNAFSSGQADAWGEVLWNFADATSFTIQGVNFGGTILAPKTALTLKNGQVNGQVVAGSLVSTGAIHNFRFQGTVAPSTAPDEQSSSVPEPGTLTLAATGALLLLAGNWRRTRGKRAGV